MQMLICIVTLTYLKFFFLSSIVLCIELKQGSEFHGKSSPPTSSAEQSDAWHRVTVGRQSAISVVKGTVHPKKIKSGLILILIYSSSKPLCVSIFC